jgi:hypothetical protein
VFLSGPHGVAQNSVQRTTIGRPSQHGTALESRKWFYRRETRVRASFTAADSVQLVVSVLCAPARVLRARHRGGDPGGHVR